MHLEMSRMNYRCRISRKSKAREIRDNQVRLNLGNKDNKDNRNHGNKENRDSQSHGSRNHGRKDSRASSNKETKDKENNTVIETKTIETEKETSEEQTNTQEETMKEKTHMQIHMFSNRVVNSGEIDEAVKHIKKITVKDMKGKDLPKTNKLIGQREIKIAKVMATTLRKGTNDFDKCYRLKNCEF